MEREAVSVLRPDDVQRDLVSDVRHLAFVVRLSLALDQVGTDPVLGVGSIFDAVIGFFDSTFQASRPAARTRVVVDRAFFPFLGMTVLRSIQGAHCFQRDCARNNSVTGRNTANSFQSSWFLMRSLLSC